MKTEQEKRMKSLRNAYSYTKEISKSSSYKIQFVALKKYFKNCRTKFNRHLRSYMLGKFRNVQKRDVKLIRDFAFKNDFMTPRQSVLFTPKAYLYFTTQTFELSRKIKDQTFSFIDDKNYLNFSTKHVKVFYAGFYNFNRLRDKSDAVYKKSYKLFQRYLKSFEGSRVLKIDIQNFFLGITIKRLDNQLKKIIGPMYKNYPVEKDNIIKFLENSGITTLPQSQGSLASSILSQFYLHEFTRTLEQEALRNNLEIVRYVDDTFIKIPDYMSDKKINELINFISSELWKYGLNLNISKTKIYSKEEFSKEVDFNLDGVSMNGQGFIQKDYIKQKVNEIVANDGQKFIEFLSKVHDIYNKFGNDMDKYNKVVNEYFSVGNDNANKIQNSLIFGKKLLGISIQSRLYILDYMEIMTFDPGKYVPLLVMIENSINMDSVSRKNNFNVDKVEQYIYMNTIYNKKIYSVREGLMDSNYYIQKNGKNNKVNIYKNYLKRIISLNKGYYEYILKYVH